MENRMSEVRGRSSCGDPGSTQKPHTFCYRSQCSLGGRERARVFHVRGRLTCTRRRTSSTLSKSATICASGGQPTYGQTWLTQKAKTWTGRRTVPTASRQQQRVRAMARMSPRQPTRNAKTRGSRSGCGLAWTSEDRTDQWTAPAPSAPLLTHGQTW